MLTRPGGHPGWRVAVVMGWGWEREGRVLGHQGLEVGGSSTSELSFIIPSDFTYETQIRR